jgi:hypothetical protein
MPSREAFSIVAKISLSVHAYSKSVFCYRRQTMGIIEKARQERLLQLVNRYRSELMEAGVQSAMWPPGCTFRGASEKALLSHALFLCSAIHDQLAIRSHQTGRAHRLLGTLQMCLSLTGKYTPGELEEHNRELDK